MKHLRIFHFVILVFILASGAGIFLANQNDSWVQFVVGVLTAIFYVIWGIVHHMTMQDLHRKVVIEYVLVSIIAIVLLYTVLGF